MICADDDFFSRKKVKMKMGVQLPSEDSAELERMSDKETDITKERINKIIAPSASFQRQSLQHRRRE